MNTHPLARISVRIRPTIFGILLTITLVIMVILNISGGPLRNEVAPAAIVSYELAGDVDSANNILESWDNAAKVYAGFNLGFDYLWMIFYSTTIALGLVWTADTFNLEGGLATAITLLAWGQWLAALLDALENSSLLVMLFGEAVSPWPQIAYWSAVIKFILVFLGIVVVLAGAIIYRLHPLLKRKRNNDSLPN